MDINLPGMSGLDALAVLRAGPKTADIPVVALSSSASDEDRRRGKEAMQLDHGGQGHRGREDHQQHGSVVSAATQADERRVLDGDPKQDDERGAAEARALEDEGVHHGDEHAPCPATRSWYIYQSVLTP
jgi:hypothetical protein